ncbi:hypothetical protein [Marinimicrobium agarilyticum]|uniref:hypothetical protein n=1 Tax=Marinimicrobium agarilyticum TaxID=306546 RepID=UPI0004170A07|nr:hypothetical protein [Marinimicrobium agarilyticum]
MKTFTVSAVALALSALLLTACGAEREEPFNPPEEDDEVREAVAAPFFDGWNYDLRGGAWPSTDTATGKRLEVITNVYDFDLLVSFYGDPIEAPNFEERTLLLYDSGWTDNGSCKQQILLDRVEAFQITEDDDETVVEVVLTYDREVPDDSAVCEEDQEYRLVELYSINTTGEIIITEQIQGLNDDNASSSSRRSSSSSSNSSSL